MSRDTLDMSSSNQKRLYKYFCIDKDRHKTIYTTSCRLAEKKKYFRRMRRHDSARYWEDRVGRFSTSWDLEIPWKVLTDVVDVA
jgi:hypothetical protein